MGSRHTTPTLYWFPRDCPRGTFWATRDTSADAELLADATRVHAAEGWVDRIGPRVVAYRVPEDTFAPHHDVGGYWISREPVTPIEMTELGDLLCLHADARIELRLVDLGRSGLASATRRGARRNRLRNAVPAQAA